MIEETTCSFCGHFPSESPALEHKANCLIKMGFWGAPFERLPDVLTIPSGEWILDGYKYENRCNSWCPTPD